MGAVGDGRPDRLDEWPIEARFWLCVEGDKTDDECWPWLGSLDRNGYGLFFTSRTHAAHRMAYELEVGPVPDGLVIDHLCRNPPCQNPSHMEPVTRGENVLRGVAPTAINARKTHCAKGHLLDGDNVIIQSGRPGRRCRTCHLAWRRAAYAAGRAA